MEEKIRKKMHFEGERGKQNNNPEETRKMIAPLPSRNSEIKNSIPDEIE